MKNERAVFFLARLFLSYVNRRKGERNVDDQLLELAL